MVGQEAVNQDDFRSARDDSYARKFVYGTSIFVAGEEFLVCLGRLGNVLLRLLEDGKECGGVEGENWSSCQKQTQRIQLDSHCPSSARALPSFVW